MLISKEKDVIESWSPRYASLRYWFPIIEEYARLYEADGIPSARLSIMKPPEFQQEQGGLGPHKQYVTVFRKTYRTSYEGKAIRKHPIKTRRNVTKVLGYISLAILLAGISYFACALLVKHGLVEPLSQIPLP